MGMLDAIIRGAAGQGLIDLSNRMDRRDAAASEEARRKREREEELAWRAAENQKDRDSRAASAATRTSRSGSGGGGDGGSDAAYRYAVAELMTLEGISEGQARALIESSRADTNPLTKAVEDESGGHSAPDPERWAKINRIIGRALETADAKSKSNFDQLAKGEKTEWQTRSGMLAQQRPGLAPDLARGVATADGKPLVGGDSNVTRDNFSGKTEVTPVGKSIIAKNNAQAGKAGREAKDNDPLAKLPPAVRARLDLVKKRAEMVSAAILRAQADPMNPWDPEKNPGQAKLQTELSDLDKEARELLKPHLPKPKVDPAQARREAEAAVAAGAPLDKVNARLKDLGLEPIGAQPKAEAAKPAAPEKKPGSAGAKPSAPELETTKAASGKTMYRYKGQDRWYDSKEEALANLGSRNRSGMLSRGDAMAPEY